MNRSIRQNQTGKKPSWLFYVLTTVLVVVPPIFILVFWAGKALPPVFVFALEFVFILGAIHFSGRKERFLWVLSALGAAHYFTLLFTPQILIEYRITGLEMYIALAICDMSLFAFSLAITGIIASVIRSTPTRGGRP